jgi:hypothetical protein
MPAVLVGPAWSERTPLATDAGIQPLGVENATLTNAGRLVPAVVGAATLPRYMLLHALLAGLYRADRREDLPDAYEKVRRAEVVVGAVSKLHAVTDPDEHFGPLRPAAPHGDRKLGDVTAGIDVPALAAVYANPAEGFLGLYRGSEQAIGLLAPVRGVFAPGPVPIRTADSPGLDRVVEAAESDRLSRDDLEALAGDACICAVRQADESALLRSIVFGRRAGLPAAPQPIRDRRRETAASGRLLLRSLEGKEVAGTYYDRALAAVCVSGDLAEVPDDLHLCALRWRGTLLRNASVTAWRMLWRWLTDQLPATEDELADRLAESLCAAAGTGGTASAALWDVMPPGRDGGRLRYPEYHLLYPDDGDGPEPWDLLRVLALGTRRLDDLDGTPAKQAFLTRAELGPLFVRDWLSAHGSQPLAELGRRLCALLLAHARRISWQRLTWSQGRLRLPTRLVSIGDDLHLVGSEGTGSPGLRLGALAGLLRDTRVLTATDDGHYVRGDAASEVDR